MGHPGTAFLRVVGFPGRAETDGPVGRKGRSVCGICGILYFDRGRPVSEDLLSRMTTVLKHRGPDDSGVWTEGHVGLGLARLAIIDLSPLGHQPMSNEDGSVWITFNGEIYNFPELRQELLEKGHSFRSRTDTETILHLWEEEGEHCVERLRGMFAFAIWDGRKEALFLARDRLGKKPLFYAPLRDRLLFGSEIKAILQDPEFPREPDLEAIHHYLAYQSVPAPYCAFRGIRKLAPGHCLLYQRGQGEPRQYWRLSYRNQRDLKGPHAAEDLQREIVERLREAVRIRLMSDVPLGAFLSGGVDSSMVVALMAGLMDQPVKTFSIGFAQEKYNELPYARKVAERYGTDHHEFIVTPDAQAIFPELVWHYNEPFADSSAIPTYYVAKMAREYVTVVLSGDGGDEDFAGYQRYEHHPEYTRRRHLPASIWWPVPRPVRAWRAFGAGRSRWGTTLARLRALSPRKLTYYYRITQFNEIYQAELYTPEFRRRLGDCYTVDLMLDRLRQSDATEELDTLLGLDLGLYLPDTLMTKMDIASMAHGLEVRAPMLDHPFVEFVAGIPSAWKLRDGHTSKYVFKQAAEPFLPAEVIQRSKMGFRVPIGEWFRNELREMVTDVLLSPRALQRGYFRREYVERMVSRHQRGEVAREELIWNLLMLELWHLMFIDETWPIPEAHRAGIE